MKDTFTDANFPRTAEQRVYHLGVRPGEVANRIVTIGSPSRANRIAAFLDSQPKPFVLLSERGFLTITGRYKGTPVSIISIGMGSPNMDFFVREVRETVSGDLAIVRLGSCGGLVDVPPGTVVVPSASVAITRNVDFDFVNPENSNEPAYRISKLVPADAALKEELRTALQTAKPSSSTSAIITGVVNASADSFYSSQGRQTSFPDRNEDVIQHLQNEVPKLATLEMETFHLYHLAACWAGRIQVTDPGSTPLTTGPVSPTISQTASSPTYPVHPAPPAIPNSVIRAAAAHLVFASRKSQDFITPEQVAELENWTGQGVLNALVNLTVPQDRLHPDQDTVWQFV